MDTLAERIHAIRFDPQVSLVAVIGGPCGGKTEFLKRTPARIESHNVRTFVLKETATELIDARFPPFPHLWPAQASLGFQRHVLLYSLEREMRYVAMAKELEPDKRIVILCDRGVLDGKAYVGGSDFARLLQEMGLSFHDLRERYRGAVHLVTAADGAEQYYTLGNNAARSETPERARELDRLTLQAWQGHQHLHVIDNSTGFDQKMARALGALGRILHMPEPMERERKFVLRNFSDALIPPDAVAIGIVQHYLIPKGDGMGRRVRRRHSEGVTSYFYTEKRETGVPGERIERERELSVSEYEALLCDELDKSARAIIKLRHSFVYKGRHIELDQYRLPKEMADKVVVEVELQDLSETVEFPPGWDLVEVTADPRYSNYSIAKGQCPLAA